MAWFLRLDDPACRDPDQVGGKAYGLAAVHAMGVPVPPTWVLTTEALCDHLRATGLTSLSDEAALGEALTKTPLTAALAGELRVIAGGLGPWLAVRSSAVGEDSGEHSFAGQYESVLGVAPGDATEDAVRRCWASLYSERARRYRSSHGVTSPRMAVVLQGLVDAQAAGVLFTVHPLNGSWREMVAEAVWGQGEALVSGRVAPDHYRVARPRRIVRPVRVLGRAQLTVLSEEIRVQENQMALGPLGLQESQVAPARVGAPKLRHDQLLQLSRLGLRIEGRLGAPQDIEWILDRHGRFVVLQSRPVTTRPVTRGGAVVWTRRFLGERWVGPATPLGWSLMQRNVDRLVSYPETSRRFLGGQPPTRLVRFAPYVNATVFRHLAFKLPGAPPPQFMMELLPPEEARSWVRRFAHRPDFQVYGSIFRETALEKRWERFSWKPWRNWRDWAAFEVRLDAALTGMDAQPASVSEALALHRRCEALADEYLGIHICSLLFAGLLVQVVQGMLHADGKAGWSNDLFRPDALSWTHRTDQALWRLSLGRVSMEDFLRDFGHRAPASWELFSPRWFEDSGPARTLSARLGQDGLDPLLRVETQIREADHRMAALRGPLRSTVSVLRRYLRLREDQRFHFDRLTWRWKQAWLFLERDTGLALRYLDRAEALALLDDPKARPDVAPTIEAKQLAWLEETRRRAGGDEPPDFLVGDLALDVPSGATALHGDAISPGVGTGTARIIRSLDDAKRFQRGDVLVTTATDPAWTPLFVGAAGIVLERGGVLSHGAVVAREYGVPAVANAMGACSSFRDGSTITVDGTRGLVWAS